MYKGSPHYSHDQIAKTGVLLTNLGTPDAPTRKALKTYLAEFLWDPRVVEVPRPIWWLILNAIILNIRPAKSAKAYASVWTERGSPLMSHTQDQCAAIADALHNTHGNQIVVDFAMRYGNPSISSALQKMADAGVQRLLVLPLYPQYSGATTGSTFDAISHDFRQRRWLPDFRFISHYHDFEPLIDAMAQHIAGFWETHGRADKLLFSYHGVPKRYLLAGDPYHCECYKTSRLLAEKLNLTADEYYTSFQSRFGREEWLKPYTDHTLKAWPDEGVKSVQVFCPGFSADCLETIEEIGEENKEYFLEAGGEHYDYISCLNAETNHITALTALIEQHLSGWHHAQSPTPEQSQTLALKLGAVR